MESKINVSVRVKPLNDKESLMEKNHMWSVVSDTTLMNKRTKEVYTFDNVFGPDISTQEIFESTCKEIVRAAMDGINQTVFAYGQTSSGKTYTMKGYQNDGLIPLAVQELFSQIQQRPTKKFEVTVEWRT